MRGTEGGEGNFFVIRGKHLKINELAWGPPEDSTNEEKRPKTKPPSPGGKQREGGTGSAWQKVGKGLWCTTFLKAGEIPKNEKRGVISRKGKPSPLWYSF